MLLKVVTLSWEQGVVWSETDGVFYKQRLRFVTMNTEDTLLMPLRETCKMYIVAWKIRFFNILYNNDIHVSPLVNEIIVIHTVPTFFLVGIRQNPEFK
jgi:hypothetical protein